MNNKSDILVQFGLAIKKHRLMNNFSQEELAGLTGLHRTYIGAVERGERNLTLLKIYQISQALKVKMSDLLIELEESI